MQQVWSFENWNFGARIGIGVIYVSLILQDTEKNISSEMYNKNEAFEWCPAELIAAKNVHCRIETFHLKF